MKNSKYIIASSILLIAALILLWFSFVKPSITLSDWKISNDGNFYLDTYMPHYSYHTLLPYLYFKGDLIVPDGIRDYVMEMTVDGCFEEVQVNDQLVYENTECDITLDYDEQSIDLTSYINLGKNQVEVKINFNGATTRFEIFEPRKYNLLRFSLAVAMISLAIFFLTKNPRIVFSFLLLSLVFLHVFSSYFPVRWGFNALGYFPLYVSSALAFICALLAIPSSYDSIASNSVKVFNKLKKDTKSMRKKLSSMFNVKLPASMKNYFMYSLISLISFLVFWLFRTHHSMGDSGFVGQIALHREYLFFHGSALAAWTLSFVYSLLKNFGFEYNSYEASALAACFFGAISVPAIWIICRELFDSTRKRFMLFFIVVSAYSMQLFFGYIEFYPMLLAAMIYYTLTGICYLRDKVSIVYPSIAFVIMFCTHLSSGFLGPSLIMLYLYKAYTKREKVVGEFLQMFFSASILLVIFFSYVIFIHGQCNQSSIDCVINYVSGVQQYASDSKGGALSLFRSDILTPTFIQELFIEYSYISSGAVILFFFLITFYNKSIDFRDPFLLFLLISTASIFFYTTTHITALGLPYDWDSTAPIGFPLTLLLGYLLLTVVKDKKLLTYYVVSLVSVILLIHTIPTLLVSADREDVLLSPREALSVALDDFKTFLSELTSKATQEKVSMGFVDSLDVGNNQSETYHHYTLEGEIDSGVYASAYANGTEVQDNYRIYLEYESFIVSSQPNTELIIVKRVRCPSSQETRAYLHGSYLGKLSADCANSGEKWKDIQITEPKNLIEGDKVGLMFVSDDDEPVESYHYWFYSKDT